MRVFYGSCLLLLCLGLSGQSTDFPLFHPAYNVVEIKDITSENSFSTSIKPFSRSSTADFLDVGPGSYLSLEMRPHSPDSTQSKKSFLNKLFQNPADFYAFQNDNLDLHVNPVLQFSFGKTNDDISTTYVNTRGIEIRGVLDKKIAFYTFLTENQVRYPEYINQVRDSTLVVPLEGFWKRYNDTGVDFFRAQGYVDFGISQSVSAQLGYGKHFVGDGIRSLILSNYANNYPYLRINTQTKVFDYTNIFAELISEVDGNRGGTFGFSPFSKKYMAFHHLNIKIKPNLHIGLFESVMFGDSTGGLKIEYLNPVIFYRSVEQQNGSADNALLGLDFKWNIKNRVSLYGQLVVDEMIVSEVFGGNGWWGNKQGFQLGAKYANAFGVDDLLIQGEINRVRPYMYAHESGFTSYSHYNLALAHPLGANFTEYLVRAQYRMNDKWNFEGSLLLAQYGNDQDGENFGRDILKNYTIRRLDANGRNIDFGNEHLQGNKTELIMFFSRFTYMWKHNLFTDADVTFRKETDTNGLIDYKSVIFGLSLRWNIPTKTYLF